MVSMMLSWGWRLEDRTTIGAVAIEEAGLGMLENPLQWPEAAGTERTPTALQPLRQRPPAGRESSWWLRLVARISSERGNAVGPCLEKIMTEV